MNTDIEKPDDALGEDSDGGDDGNPSPDAEKSGSEKTKRRRSDLPQTLYCYVPCPPGEYRDSFIDGRALKMLRAVGRVKLNDADHYLEPEEYGRTLARTHVLFTLPDTPPLTPKLLAAMPRLRVVAHIGDSIGPVFSTELLGRDIALFTAGRFTARFTAENIICYMTMLFRKIPQLTLAARRGEWRYPPDADFGGTRSLTKKKIGLIGCGYCGMYLSLMLENSYWTSTLAWDPILTPAAVELAKAKYAEPDEIFRTCDAVVINLAPNPMTVGFVDAEKLAMLRDGAILVNTSFGGAIDETALIRELQTGRISAALDVTEKEPPEPNNPLLSLPNVIVTPHICAYPDDRRADMFCEMAEEVLRWKNGDETGHDIQIEHALGFIGNPLARVFIRK